MSLLKTLKAGTANTKTVTFPGTDKKITLRILNNQDLLESSLAADRLYKQNEIAIGFNNISDYESEKTTQQLFRACIDPETGKPAAESITEFRMLLSGAERAALIEEYNNLERECNPSPEKLSQEDFDALVEGLKKKPQETIGNISSFSTLKRLALFLVEEQQTSPKDSGSTSM